MVSKNQESVWRAKVSPGARRGSSQVWKPLLIWSDTYGYRCREAFQGITPLRMAIGRGHTSVNACDNLACCEELPWGLESGIWPECDVINKDGQSITFTARALSAATITNHSPMIGKGIQYGYVCTGEAFVILHIPDDLSTVYFSVYRPNLKRG
ncbi:hypothetical protein B0T25DRAFT_529652 [Lasiosphaeria hispida]|uniref:Uncharacterized protein n=1 Tax=Lasiosphaeria hispida TaxID=260671 RepID=A0AAJ0HWL6_9PEZI|nr:hypothetical protein B0T25DRAFT_529652 [Lasiosphaeria hispida]